jgi:DNA-binding CsgD family transcriptional regulator
VGGLGACDSGGRWTISCTIRDVIVGRDELLALIATALTEDAEQRALLITGEVGMGKTALLHSAGARAAQRGVRVLRAAVSEGGDGDPFALVEDLARHLPRRTSRRTSRQGQDDGDEAVLHDLASASTPRVTDVLVRLLAELARDQPVLVLVDDIPWADEQSLAALTLAMARLAADPVVTVATARARLPLDRRLARWRQVDLPPLSEPDAITVLHGAVGHQLRPEQARRVVRALGCCPLALVECRRLLSDEQISGEEPLPTPIPVDERLRQAWGTSAAQLTAAGHDALLALCVLDSPRLDVLDAVLRRRGRALADLSGAVAAGLVRWPAGGVPQPVSPWACAGVLDRCADASLREAHRDAAAAAVSLALPPALVLRHLARAARPGDESLALELDEQSRRARHADQPEVAARGWEAAARVTADPTLRARWAVQAAQTWLEESTSRDGGAALLSLMHEVDLAPGDAIWRDWLHAEVLAEHDLAESAAALELAAERAWSSAPSLVPWLLWGAASTWWLVGDTAAGLRVAHRLCEESPATLLPPWLGPAVLGTAQLQAGEIDRAVPLLSEAIEASRAWSPRPTTPLSHLVNVVALDELLLAQGPERDARLEELTRRLQDDTGQSLAAARVMQAWRAQRRGEWGVARHHLDDALDLARATRARAQETAGLCLAVVLDALTGDDTRLDRDLDDLTTLATRVGDQHALTYADAARGLAALAAGRVEEAVMHLEPLASSPALGRGMADPPLLGRVSLVEAYCRAGETRRARRLLSTLTELLSRLPDPAARAARERCRALCGPAEEADACFARALDAHASTPDRFEEARTRLLLGEHLRRTHRRAEARQELRRATAAFDRLGATPWHDWALHEARAAGASPPPAGSGVEVLTPQERRVVEVVAGGASNQDAAAALFLSPRTVEYHLSSAYRKLGVTSRTALAHLVAGQKDSDGGGDRRGSGQTPGAMSTNRL